MEAMNVGNFKGVMLCNRPTTTPSSNKPASQSSSSKNSNQTSSSGERPAFVSTVCYQEPVGISNAKRLQEIHEKGKQNVKVKKLGVNVKHKKWLIELQNNRRKTLAKVKEQAEKKNNKKKQQSIVSKTAPEAPKIEAKNETNIVQQQQKEEIVQVQQQQQQQKEEVVQVEQQQQPIQQEQQQQQRNDALAHIQVPNKPRPKWTMTSEELEDVENEEVDDLLDFTSNLDFEEYINDMEVREAVKFVKQRITEIEKSEIIQQRKEETRLKASEYAATHGTVRENDNNNNINETRKLYNTNTTTDSNMNVDGWNSSTRVHDDGPIISVTDRIAQQISGQERIKHIHSSRSVKSIVETVISDGPTTLEKTSVAKAVLPPTISIVHHKDTMNTIQPTEIDALSAKKKDVRASNLPFLYRHPGI